jgi:CubicO group peptidase (beta-lactamase class C family)
MRIIPARSCFEIPLANKPLKKTFVGIASMALFLLAFACTASAQTLDEYVNAQMQWEHIPGLSLAVMKDGKIILAKGYGLASHRSVE